MDIHRITAHRALFSSLTFCCLLASAMIATAKKPPLKPININVATSEELQQVPGIGPVTADKILQMRKSYGAFKSVDDLLAVKGLGKKRLEKMRKYLTVSKAAASKGASQTPRNTPPPAAEAEAPPN
jgi:competence ComEA-like helix-hairpin-helix protein